MTLKHTTGQRLDCAIEIFIRDNEADPEKGGDVLICEVSDTGRWLLFPPIIQEMVSARHGKEDRELIMMIRGVGSDGNDWSELLTLHSSTADAVDEWADMLEDGPVPPSPTQTDFIAVQVASEPPTPMSVPETPLSELVPAPLSPTITSPSSRSEKPSVAFKSRTPSPKEVEIPIGEQARKTSKRWSFNMGMATELINQATPGVFKKVSGSHPPVSMENRRNDNRRSSREGRPLLTRTQRDALFSSPPTPNPPSPGSDWTESTIRTKSPTRSPQQRRPSVKRTESALGSELSSQSSQRDYSVWMPSTSSQLTYDDDESDVEDDRRNNRRRSRSVERPVHSRTASTPSRDLPNIPKLRKSSPPQTPRPAPARSQDSYVSSQVSREAPSSAPGKLQKVVTAFKLDKKSDPAPRSAAQTPTRPKSGLFSTPNFLKRNRRASSPLKREYAPSIHDVASDSEISDDDFSDDESITSYNSDVDEKKGQLAVIEPPLLAPATINEFPLATPPQSLASISGPSLQPSNSASQGPYRSTPHQPGAEVAKTVASIFSWSDRGFWDPLHPVEILVVVSPGMIEAFSMSEAYDVAAKLDDGREISPSEQGVMPLVALELTPLVPLRRGTALDISIRSPPTAASKIKSSNNVMFRSRTPDECEKLYNLINQARINNATYIALQNARPYTEGGTWAAQMDRRNQMRTSSNSSSWFGLGSRRGSTYRSNSIRKRQPSIANSESSVGTMNTAFSALRRLSGSGLRSFSRSRFASSTTNSDSLSSGYATPARQEGDHSNGAVAPDLALGLKEVKIRLYHRETGSKWRDMGSARLTIMLPPSHPNSGYLDSSRPSSPAPGPRSAPGSERRILITGTTKGETLLDVTLGEGSFERVARTGIAVSVWRDNEGSRGDSGRAKDKGGVGASYMDVFMIQMKSVSQDSRTEAGK